MMDTNSLEVAEIVERWIAEHAPGRPDETR
jgi:hypothetical protein